MSEKHGALKKVARKIAVNGSGLSVDRRQWIDVVMTDNAFATWLHLIGKSLPEWKWLIEKSDDQIQDSVYPHWYHQGRLNPDCYWCNRKPTHPNIPHQMDEPGLPAAINPQALDILANPKDHLTNMLKTVRAYNEAFKASSSVALLSAEKLGISAEDAKAYNEALVMSGWLEYRYPYISAWEHAEDRYHPQIPMYLIEVVLCKPTDFPGLQDWAKEVRAYVHLHKEAVKSIDGAKTVGEREALFPGLPPIIQEQILDNEHGILRRKFVTNVEVVGETDGKSKSVEVEGPRGLADFASPFVRNKTTSTERALAQFLNEQKRMRQ